jgi:prepilin-type N-terminal cleavage/methylation domain-containing protein
MKSPSTNQGFTLIELMVAMVVLAIGIMATIAMQYTALAGYTASREMTGAVEVARSVEQRLKTEALAWQIDGMPTATTVFDEEESLLAGLTPGVWTMVNREDEPMSVRMADGNGPQRFCAFVTGGQLTEDGIPQPYMQATIAVVYPAANSQFPGVAEGSPWGDCSEINDTLLTPGDRTALESAGLRVVYLSTGIRPLA